MDVTGIRSIPTPGIEEVRISQRNSTIIYRTVPLGTKVDGWLERGGMRDLGRRSPYVDITPVVGAFQEAACPSGGRLAVGI